MIRAEFNFEENGIKAKGFFNCIVTDLEKGTYIPVGEPKIEQLKFFSKGEVDFEKIKQLCWKNAIGQIY